MRDLPSITFPEFQQKAREQQNSKLLMQDLIYQEQSCLLAYSYEKGTLQIALA